MGDFEDHSSSWSMSGLLCHETEASCLNEDEEACTCFDEKDNFHNMGCDSDRTCYVLDTEDVEYIERLIEMEKAGFVHTGLSLSSFDDCSAMIYNHQWLKRARLDAIRWILNTRAIFGFQFQTAYLSMTYFDLFLSKRFVDEGKVWAIRLLCLACLSLAAKMEECRVPPLTEFPLEEYCFESKTIQRMELLVLSALDWKMRLVTPFAYVHYFIHKIYGESRSQETASKVVELIVAIIKDINLLDHRPSIIAAAAVLAASNENLTRKELEHKMDSISCWGSVENEHTFSCYIAMQRVEMVKLKTPEKVVSTDSSSICSSAIDVQGNSCFTSGAGLKRRLTFNDSDNNYPVKKIFRLQ
ncbi:hypothetical protein Tsubulata_039231 [Turnera subulata]|uniref:B-like cyclin n=1 Tax=Turnera subulata TaxID=218843 RepID=A0A9Q0FCC5_9ROSI|nr:hypothetical protein Tsubulata_039231 [Turnera subulata]